jgi:hypothetical protein
MASTRISSLWLLHSYSRERGSLDSFSMPQLPLTLDDSLGLLVIAVVSIAYLSRGLLWNKKDPLHHLWFEKPQEDLSERGLESLNRNIATKLEESVRNSKYQPTKRSAKVFHCNRIRILSFFGDLNPAPQNVLGFDCQENYAEGLA